MISAVPDGTSVEFYAEQDVYAVLSNCPYADQALPFPEADPNPVYITVWDTGIEPYSRNHLDLPGDFFWRQTVLDRIASKETSPK